MALEEPTDLGGPVKDHDGIPTYVEPPLENYMRGMTIDYQLNIMGDGFVVTRGQTAPEQPCH